ncbi:CHAP domain-containing protein [Antrihabitans sp. YC2-6]|uniref:CHAP domain-containing protein n=1 Tax=Antrihabitans sp. YC2-6 TaxID=2799498 RepID=UPI0018F644A0|nr:CHAP domain-containing protein [Antrihabitans sp. YC2-6]MBJ8343928.1 CHAP domain-containing protein [Antrihabitans sp. YC2-6]
MTISLEQFKNNTLGRSYGNPGTGTYVGECVSYVRLYMEEVLGIKTAVWGHARDYYFNPQVLALFERVPVAQSQDGDVAVWTDDEGNWTGPEGHIGIKYKGGILNQNYGGSRVVSINHMFSQGFLGYLRLKGQDMNDIADREFVALATVLAMNVQPEVNQVFMNNIGNPKTQVLQNMLNYQESKSFRLRAGAYDELQARIKQLEAQLKAAGADQFEEVGTVLGQPVYRRKK